VAGGDHKVSAAATRCSTELSCAPCSVRQPSVPWDSLLSQATTGPPPYRAKTAERSATVGVLFAPPLRLTTAIVRGPGQCCETVCMSSRSDCSSGDGSIGIPSLFKAPRQPLVAGADRVSVTKNVVSRSALRLGYSVGTMFWDGS